MFVTPQAWFSDGLSPVARTAHARRIPRGRPASARHASPGTAVRLPLGSRSLSRGWGGLGRSYALLPLGRRDVTGAVLWPRKQHEPTRAGRGAYRSIRRSLLTWGEGGGVSMPKARRGAEQSRARGRSRGRTAGFVLALRYLACGPGRSDSPVAGRDGVTYLLSGPSLRRALPSGSSVHPQAGLQTSSKPKMRLLF